MQKPSNVLCPLMYVKSCIMRKKLLIINTVYMNICHSLKYNYYILLYYADQEKEVTKSVVTI